MTLLRGRWMLLLAVLAGGLFMSPGAWAQDEPAVEAAVEAVEEAAAEAAEDAPYSYDWETSAISEEMFTVNNLWIMISGCLVFIMHLGFACVETGLTRAKNTVNILFKNTMIVMIGISTTSWNQTCSTAAGATGSGSPSCQGFGSAAWAATPERPSTAAVHAIRRMITVILPIPSTTGRVTYTTCQETSPYIPSPNGPGMPETSILKLALTCDWP